MLPIRTFQPRATEAPAVILCAVPESVQNGDTYIFLLGDTLHSWYSSRAEFLVLTGPTPLLPDFTFGATPSLCCSQALGFTAPSTTRCHQWLTNPLAAGDAMAGIWYTWYVEYSESRAKHEIGNWCESRP